MTRIDAAAMDSETMQMLSVINEEKDCNIVINSEGIIQFANKGLTYVGLLLSAKQCSLHSDTYVI